MINNSREEYEKSPKICPICSTSINYEKRNIVKCCSGKCARKLMFDSNRPKCMVCDSIIRKRGSSKMKYCSRECRSNYEFQQLVNMFDSGCLMVESTARKIMKLRTKRCTNCQISRWNELDLVLELHHIDGDCLNNTKYNLQLLCPNCHSQTDSYKGRNKNAK